MGRAVWAVVGVGPGADRAPTLAPSPAAVAAVGTSSVWRGLAWQGLGEGKARESPLGPAAVGTSSCQAGAAESHQPGSWRWRTAVLAALPDLSPFENVVSKAQLLTELREIPAAPESVGPSTIPMRELRVSEGSTQQTGGQT